MAAVSFFRTLYLNYLVKPKSERAIFRNFSHLKPQKIVEFGLDSGERAIDLIELAQRYRPTVEIRYTGFDSFDARENGEALPLKQVHRELKTTGAKIQLIPGDPFQSLARSANQLASTDVVIFSADVIQNGQPNWFYLPRMLNDHSVVFIQHEADGVFEQLSFKQVESLAKQSETSKAA